VLVTKGYNTHRENHPFSGVILIFFGKKVPKRR